jgi:adenylate kinase
LEDKVNIVLFGPPGAGKGTQANNLVDEFNFIKVSTGDLLRNEIKENSHLGKKIASLIDKGLFVPDDFIKSIVEKIINEKINDNSFIFDGYPRNLNQAKDLDLLVKEKNKAISHVFSLEVDFDIIVKRILGRLICSKCDLTFNEFFNPPTSSNHKCEDKFLQRRSDDSENTIKNRLETYIAETSPILKYYKNRELLTDIDGMRKIDEIYKEIRQIITTLKT